MPKPETLKIDDIEYVRKDSLVPHQPKSETYPYEIGTAYFIRTVTHYFTGRLVGITPSELILDQCAWIADTGRHANALKSGVFNEVEPYPDVPVIVNRAALIDASPFGLALPRGQK